MSDIAQRYGLALYQVTHENQSSERVHKNLTKIVDIFREKDVLDYFKARDVDRAQKLQVLERSFKDGDQEILGLLKLLVRNHRFYLLPEIVLSFEQIYYKEENVKIANVTSAIELSPDEEKQLLDALTKRYLARIDLRIKVDPSLLSGMIIHIDTDIIDNSLKSKFESLKQSLLQGGNRHDH